MWTVLQLAWKQVPTKSRSKFFASDLRITFGIHVFWVQQCATGLRLAENGQEVLENRIFLLIFSVFWPPFNGLSAPYGPTSGRYRERKYASKSFTEVVFKVRSSGDIRHSLTFLFGKMSTKRLIARDGTRWSTTFRWGKRLHRCYMLYDRAPEAAKALLVRGEEGNLRHTRNMWLPQPGAESMPSWAFLVSIPHLIECI